MRGQNPLVFYILFVPSLTKLAFYPIFINTKFGIFSLFGFTKSGSLFVPGLKKLATKIRHSCWPNNISNISVPGLTMLAFSLFQAMYSPQSKEVTRGPPELVQHFRL